MNERLRELFKQAHDRKPTMVIDYETCQPIQATFRGEKMYRDEFDPEKFAELIVRECMDVVRDINQEYDGGSTVVNAADEIRAHFGVE